jgi:uncharacterized protein YjgD (DUF1641 family)
MMDMSKPIELIKEEETGTTPDSMMSILNSLMTMDRELKSLIELVQKVSQSGAIDFLKAMLEKYRDVTSVVFSELSEPENSNFIRNILTLYTLLSRVDPDILRRFMENLAQSIQSSESNRNKPPLGLLGMGREIKDPDVSAGLRVLLSAAKGFTKKDENKR